MSEFFAQWEPCDECHSVIPSAAEESIKDPSTPSRCSVAQDDKKRDHAMKYIPIIGLEIHAELTTHSKLFCRCANTSSDLTTPPNTAICPVCLGLPGALPVLNKVAVQATIDLGESLDCVTPEVSKWDRKNYFYPDLPKGYQISQYDEPLCAGGVVKWFDREGNDHSVALTRIHLEEDTGKLNHPAGADYSLIDYNRSSIPLIELVTEPVIGSAEEAKQFGEEYQLHLRELGIAEASMEKGQMRCEANISVIPEDFASDPKKRLSGTKVEIKNLNSFRSLERAINFETERQSKALEAGETLRQETRGWNEAKGETYVMRVKETSDDYRYFPEPDLYSLDLQPFKQGSDKILGTRYNWFKKLLEAQAEPKLIHAVVNDLERYMFIQGLLASGLTHEQYASAVQWIAQEPRLFEFTLQEVNDMLRQVTEKSLRPVVIKEALAKAKPGSLVATIVELESGYQVEGLDAIITKVLAANPSEVAAYKQGKQQLFGFLVGQVRKELQGKGDPVAIAEELKKQLQ